VPHTTSSDGDHTTIGRTTDEPADIENNNVATVIAILKKILFILESETGSK